MLGTFTYLNPCRIHFGQKAFGRPSAELAECGPVVQLTYGDGSIKHSGLYDDIMRILPEAHKVVVELTGVMSDPTAEKPHEGCELARVNDVDLILAVGGGTIIDHAKAASVSAWCEGDPWERYYLRRETPDNKIFPVGDICTMSGTGSEMNAGSVIANHAIKLKIGHVYGSDVIPDSRSSTRCGPAPCQPVR